MKTVKNLLNANKDVKMGNHKVVHNGNAREFYYYSTAICIVDDYARTFTINSSYGSVSTTRACNAYKKELEYMGYRED